MKVRAAVLVAPTAPLELVELDVREPGPHDVVVRIAASGVCHSDLSAADGVLVGPSPIVLGHEASGIIEHVGSEVDGRRVGEHVVLSFVPPCGGCFHCVGAEPHLCETAMLATFTGGIATGTSPFTRTDGSVVGQMSSLGTYAEVTVVPAAAAVAIDPDIALEPAAVIGCAVLTGVGAVRRTAGLQPGASVAVLGCGGVGLNVVQGARLAGAERIIAIDVSAPKLRLAETFGATDTIDASTTDSVAQVHSLTSGRGVDAAFEVIGMAATIGQAVAMARRGGQVVLVGLPALDVQLSLPVMLGLIAAEKTVRGSWYGSSVVTADIPELAQRYREGELLIDPLLSGRRPLDEVNAALADLREGSATRTLLIP